MAYMMRRALLLGTLSVTASVYLYAAESLVPNSVVDDDHAYESVIHYDEALKGYVIGEGWKITGDIRMGYVDYDYSNPPSLASDTINKGHIDSRGFYVIPKISIASPTYEGFSFKITGARATDFGLNDRDYESRNFVFDPTERKSFAILQEAYVRYQSQSKAHEVVVGAKETVTPMVDADDWYMLANSFQGAYYVNRSFSNLTLAGGYFYKMAGVWDSGANGTEWHSMSDASFVDGGYKKVGGDEGVWTAALQYSKDAHTLQVWNYYMQDYYNTFFAQYDYKGEASGFTYDAGFQLIDFQGVGGLKDYYRDVLGGREIDYSIYSLRLDTKHESGFDLSLDASFYTDGDGTGDTLGAWGGYPYFANGMIFHFFEAGSLRNTNSYKAQVGYDCAKQGIDGLWVGFRYTYFDLDPDYSISSLNGKGQDAQKNYGLRVSYNDPSGLYFTGTYEFVDLDEQKDISGLRLIGGYRF